MGALEVESGTSASIQPFDGPSGSYQGYALLDPHAVYPATGNPATAPAFMVNPSLIGVDTIPQTFNTTLLGAAQIGTIGSTVALATVAVTNFSAGAASIAFGVPFIPSGTTTPINVIALDFGFTTGTTVANSSVVTCPNNTLFQVGQWVVLGNVANAAGTASLITQVQSLGSTAGATSSITVGPNLPATALGIPIGGANAFATGLVPPAYQFGPSATIPNGVTKHLAAGKLRVANPAENCARGLQVQVSTNAASGAGAVTITGYDIYHNLMTEQMTASAGTTPVYGKKAFKYISSGVFTANTGTANLSLGISDVMGLAFKCDYVQQLEYWAGNTASLNNVGFSAASMVAATNTTLDVRGVIQLSGIGGGSALTNAATTNNVLRFTVAHDVPPYAMTLTTPNNLMQMFGTTQA
jgi:hypothetical protein